MSEIDPFEAALTLALAVAFGFIVYRLLVGAMRWIERAAKRAAWRRADRRAENFMRTNGFERDELGMWQMIDPPRNREGPPDV